MLEGEVRLIIRPERIRWADEGKTEVAVNGIVDAVTYLGERIRYLIRLQGGEQLAVTHPNLQSERRFTPGATVKVGWNHADVAIL